MIWRRRRLGRPYDKQSQFRHRVDGGHGPPYEAAVAAAATNKANPGRGGLGIDYG